MSYLLHGRYVDIVRKAAENANVQIAIFMKLGPRKIGLQQFTDPSHLRILETVDPVPVISAVKGVRDLPLVVNVGQFYSPQVYFRRLLLARGQ